VAAFSLTLPVQASRETLWAHIRDVRWVAGLFPYVNVEAFTETAPGRWRFQRHLSIPTLAEMRWEEEATVAGDGVLAFRAVGGDLQTFDGRWRVTGDDTSAQLSLEIEYVIPDGIGPAVPTFVAAAVMHEVFKTICQRVQEAVEAGCA
jgi:hypothetical protein